MPEVGQAAYLLEALLAMKIALPGEFGPKPQTWAEVLAFSDANNIAKETWERRVLFEMSWEYVQEFTKASSPFLKSPMERSR